MLGIRATPKSRWNAYSYWGFCPTSRTAARTPTLLPNRACFRRRKRQSEIAMYIGLGTLLLVILVIWFFRRA